MRPIALVVIGLVALVVAGCPPSAPVGGGEGEGEGAAGEGEGAAGEGEGAAGEGEGVAGVGGAAHVCVANASVPPTPCHHDADCASIGLVCDDAIQNGANVTLQCAAAGTGGALGAACASTGVQDTDQCATGLCDGDTA